VGVIVEPLSLYGRIQCLSITLTLPTDLSVVVRGLMLDKSDAWKNLK